MAVLQGAAGRLVTVIVWLCLLLMSSVGRAGVPRVIVIVDDGAGWAQLTRAALPAGAAVAGMSSPAAMEGPAGVLTSIGASSPCVATPDFAPGAAAMLEWVPAGGWHVPPQRWRALRAANAEAHADQPPGTLGSGLRQVCRTVLVSAPSDSLLGATCAADRDGRLDVWAPSLDQVTEQQWTDAAVFIVPRAGDGLSLLRQLTDRFPLVPLLYITATPGGQGGKRNRDLMPVLLRGQGTGVLVSARTRWRGLVSPLDIAPTILALAGAPAGPGLALPLRVMPHAAPYASVRRLAAQARAVHHARAWLMGISEALFGIPALLGLLGLGRRWRILERWLLAGWTVPLLLVVVLPPCWQWSLGMLLAAMVVGWAAATVAIYRLPIQSAWAVSAGIGGGVLLCTTVLNLEPLRQPFLGYAVVNGYRYYGMGNEGMGVLVVLATLFAGWLQVRWPRLGDAGIYGIFACLAIVLASPWWGANWGGGMTALLTGALYLAVRHRHHCRWWHLPLAVVGAVVLGVLLIAVFAMVSPVMPTHVGALGQAMLHGGPGAVLTVIGRKIAFALRIWETYQGWSIVLWGLVLAAGLFWIRRHAAHPGALPPAYRDAAVVAWGAAVISGAINDTGILQTGMMWLQMAPAVVAMISAITPGPQPAPAPQSVQYNPD